MNLLDMIEEQIAVINYDSMIVHLQPQCEFSELKHRTSSSVYVVNYYSLTNIVYALIMHIII